MKNTKKILLLLLFGGLVMLAILPTAYSRTLNVTNATGYSSDDIFLGAASQDRILIDYNLSGSHTLQAIYSDYDGLWRGWFWNNTKWSRNDTIIAGLRNISGSVYKDVYFAGNITGESKRMIALSSSTPSNTTFHYWDGTEWVQSEITNLTQIYAITTAQSTILNNFPKGGHHTIIEKDDGGVKRGRQYNGIDWIINNSLANGLDLTVSNLGMDAHLNLTGKERWNIVITDNAGSGNNLTVFEWNNSRWNNVSINTSIDINFNTNLNFIDGFFSEGTISSCQWDSNIGKMLDFINISLSDTPPLAPTINQPVENTLYNLQPLDLNITVPTDAEGDTITQIKWYINDTFNQTTGLTNTTLNVSDGKYNLSVSVYDGYDWSSNATITSFKVDTTNPTDDLLIIIENLTFIRINTNFTIQASDANLEGHNVTAFVGDDLSGAIKFSTEVINIAGTTNNIKLEINTSWGDGRYTIVSNESDDHTTKKIGNYSIGKNEDALELEFNTTERNNKITQKLKSSDIAVLDFYAYKSKDESKYITVWNFSNTSITETIHEYKFKTNAKDDDLIYREGSKYPSHFVTKDNWIDYRLRTDYPVTYTVKETQQGKFETTINTRETTLIFESIGGKNKGGSRTQIEIDTGLPQFFNLNVSVEGLLANNSFINNATINFTINVSDKNNDSIMFNVNNVKNTTSPYVSNESKNVSITFPDGNYSVFFTINDSAGNEFNSTVINVVVDTIAPNFITAINRTITNSTIIYDDTDVNLSVFGYGDIYADTGNFSENCTSSANTWKNQTSFNKGNGTYHLIITSTNLTASEVCGWKFYGYDLAGNELDPIYTFKVEGYGRPPESEFTSGSGAGTTILASETTIMDKNLCEASSGMAWFEETSICYNCDGWIEKDEEDIMCKSCNEGFVMMGGECIPASKQININVLDKFLNKYFPDNPLFGFMLMIIAVIIIFIMVNNRKEVIKNVKKFKKKYIYD